MKTLTIYMNNGTTLRFNQISNFEKSLSMTADAKSQITFNYVSASTGEHNSAIFNNYAGYSFTREETKLNTSLNEEEFVFPKASSKEEFKLIAKKMHEHLQIEGDKFGFKVIADFGTQYFEELKKKIEEEMDKLLNNKGSTKKC